MSVECGLGKGRKIQLLFGLVLVLAFGIWCGYDGWLNEDYQPGGKKENNRLFSQAAAIACGVGVLVLVGWFARASRTRVVADDDGIDVNGKIRIAWSELTKADDSKYDKGLVRLYYEHGGQKREYLVDSYATNRFDEFLDEVSRHRPDVLAPMEDDKDDQNAGNDKAQE